MKTILFSSLISLTLVSCMKSATCTCKDSTGKVTMETSTKSTSKKSVETFKTNCNNTKMTGGGSCVVS